jgi:phosphate transport system substrate-binding protein
MVVGPIALAYKLTGVTKLVLTPELIAKIFTGKITKWNDPAIVADNAGLTPPATTITAVHRSDGSGTTHNFTHYLGKVDPDDWTFGDSNTFPPTLPGSAASGNPGVAALVEKTDGAIGYVDYATATQANLALASIKTKAGAVLAPTLEGASAALAAATANADLTYDPIAVAAEGAYPITSPTWVVIYKNQPSKAKGEALKAFLTFMLTTGQGKATSTAGYAALKGDLLTRAKEQLSQVVIPAQ